MWSFARQLDCINSDWTTTYNDTKSHQKTPLRLNKFVTPNISL